MSTYFEYVKASQDLPYGYSVARHYHIRNFELACQWVKGEIALQEMYNSGLDENSYDEFYRRKRAQESLYKRAFFK